MRKEEMVKMNICDVNIFSDEGIVPAACPRKGGCRAEMVRENLSCALYHGLEVFIKVVSTDGDVQKGINDFRFEYIRSSARGVYATDDGKNFRVSRRMFAVIGEVEKVVGILMKQSAR